MSLSSATLSVLQKVGAAAIAADTKLKAEVKEYSKRVHDAMLANPDGLKNDALFANWKIISRLSQTISNIEEEFKKLFLAASSLHADPSTPAPATKASKQGASAKRAGKKVVKAPRKVKPTVALEVASPKRKMGKSAKVKIAANVAAKVKAAPLAKPKAAPKAAPKSKNNTALKSASTAPKKVKALANTEVKVKANAKATAGAKAKKSSVSKKVSPQTARPNTLGANPTKVLRHLETLLTANDFTVVSQTAVSKETGIPLGSMTAATKKLMETGHLLAGPGGSFKLLKAPEAAALAL